jgi:glycosyltransferase involved in cell wall biosynthesis
MGGPPAVPGPKLSVVIPVYNEGGTVAEAVLQWAAELDRSALDYELLVYDDGSRDDSGRRIEALRTRVPRLILRQHPNVGHGPTVLRGYREARGEWIFQADSDSEVAPTSFRALWDVHHDHDFVLGSRQQRRSPVPRRLVTLGSRLTIRALFGTTIEDVNTPFRLMRRAPLVPLLAMLPDDCFAPNVALVGLAAWTGLRMQTVPVIFRGCRSRGGSLAGLRLWRGAIRAWWQTLTIARRVRRTMPP